MSRNAIVYQSRNRLTGTLMYTVDGKHKEAAEVMKPFPKATKADASKRYFAVCVEHKTVARFDEHYPAGRAIAHPDEWCNKCKEMIAKGTKVKAPNAVAKTPAKAVAAAPAKGKRTSSAAANKATRKRAKAAQKPSEVVVSNGNGNGDAPVDDAPATREEIEQLAESINN